MNESYKPKGQTNITLKNFMVVNYKFSNVNNRILLFSTYELWISHTSPKDKPNHKIVYYTYN